MNNSALILMATVQITVTVITLYFFYLVLKTPPKSENELED